MIISKVVENNDFPYLGKATATGTIVLFTSPKNGTVVVSGGQYALGYVSDDWEMGCFQVFRGEISLKND